LGASFSNMEGLRDWLRQHDALLSDPDFWDSEDWYSLWRQVSSPTSTEHPRPWSHATFAVPVDWKVANRPAVNSRVRIVPGTGRSGTVCGTDLTPLGIAQFTFNPHGAALDGSVAPGGKV